jgi:hypothetical protein
MDGKVPSLSWRGSIKGEHEAGLREEIRTPGPNKACASDLPSAPIPCGRWELRCPGAAPQTR